MIIIKIGKKVIVLLWRSYFGKWQSHQIMETKSQVHKNLLSDARMGTGEWGNTQKPKVYVDIVKLNRDHKNSRGRSLGPNHSKFMTFDFSLSLAVFLVQVWKNRKNSLVSKPSSKRSHYKVIIFDFSNIFGSLLRKLGIISKHFGPSTRQPPIPIQAPLPRQCTPILLKHLCRRYWCGQ